MRRRAPPTKWGMRRSSREGPCQEETGWPLGKMVVVLVAVLAVVLAAVPFMS